MEIQYYPHTCKCGCGGQIGIKKGHKYSGIPKYIMGHNIQGWNRGLTKYTDKRVAKNAEALKDSWIDEKRKERSVQFSGEGNPFYGKEHSEAFKSNRSEEYKGKFLGDKSASYGIPKTKETKLKISKSVKENYETNPKLKQYLSEIQKTKMGILAPNWNNGSSFEPYGIEFNKEFKQFIYERDNYTCQCPDCEHKTNILDAHHVDYDKKNNIPKNIITLCRSCHTKTNGKNNRQYWTEYYKNIMENK